MRVVQSIQLNVLGENLFLSKVSLRSSAVEERSLLTVSSALITTGGDRNSGGVMGFSTLFGAGLGVFVKFTSNSIRKLPLYREPWDYPLFILLGAYAGYKYPQIEERMTREVKEKRARLDQPPMQLKATFDIKKWE